MLRSCLICNCDRHEFICFCEYLLLVKANEVDYLAVNFIQASSEIGKKIKYLQAKQRTCLGMQGLRHWSGNNHCTKNSRG